MISWSAKNTPNFKTIEISAAVYSEAGANAVQELAYSMATAVDYIKELLDRGLDIDSIAKSISFEFAINNNFFMEVSKLRAVKMLWGKTY